MSDTRVTLRKEGTISIITMDDGKANVFAAAMAEQLHDCLNSIDPNEGAVIITGRPKFFSAGFDLKTIQGGDVQAGLEMRTKTINMTMDLLAFPRPVVAACTGHCMAMGALFMLTMDYRIGVRGPFKIGLNEVRDSLSLPFFGIELPRYRLPTHSFIKSALHSELYEADAAVEAGFLDEAVDPEDLMDVAMAKAQDLSQLPNPGYHSTKLNVVGELRDRILESMKPLN